MFCTWVFLWEWSTPTTHRLFLHHAISTFVGICSSDLWVTYLMKVSCRLATLFWIIGISKNLQQIVSFMIISYLTCTIVTLSILLMLRRRKTSSLLRSDTHRDQLSHSHNIRYTEMARNINYFLRRSMTFSFQKWFNSPIGEGAEASYLSAS